MNYYKKNGVYYKTVNVLEDAEEITKDEFEQHLPGFDDNQVQEKTETELIKEELERQGQAIQDLILMQLGGE